jgi:hypothetical protein
MITKLLRTDFPLKFEVGDWVTCGPTEFGGYVNGEIVEAFPNTKLYHVEANDGERYSVSLDDEGIYMRRIPRPIFIRN